MQMDSNIVIVLVGLKHSGKSSAGKLLAEHLQRPFFDSDALLEKRYATTEQIEITCREIYSRIGKQAFDDLQLETLENFFCEQSKKTSIVPVLAMGGGVGDLPELGDLLRKNSCCVILLDETLERIFERIVANGLPPFLQNVPSPFAEFQRIGAPRLKNYRAWAQIVVECRDRCLQKIVQTIMQKLQEIRQ